MEGVFVAVTISIVPLNIISIACFLFFLFKYHKANESFNPYTAITAYRAYCHVISSIITISVFLLGDKAMEMMVLSHILLDCFPIYFLFIEIAMAVNRFVAVLHYAYYDRIFTETTCKVITVSALCTSVLFTSFMKLNNLFTLKERETQQVTTIMVLCAFGFIVNAITLKRILSSYIQKSQRNTRTSSKSKKSFVFSSSQLMISCALFIHVLLLDESLLDGPIEFLILLAGNTCKDFVESIFTIYFFRHFVFDKKPIQPLVVSATIR